MEIAVSIILFVILGMIMVRLARLAGSQFFISSSIYKFFLRFSKKAGDN